MRLPRILSRPARQGSWFCPFRAGPGLCGGAPPGFVPRLMCGHAFGVGSLLPSRGEGNLVGGLRKHQGHISYGPPHRGSKRTWVGSLRRGEWISGSNENDSIRLICYCIYLMIYISDLIAQEQWALVINESIIYGINRNIHRRAVAERGAATNRI